MRQGWNGSFWIASSQTPPSPCPKKNPLMCQEALFSFDLYSDDFLWKGRSLIVNAHILTPQPSDPGTCRPLYFICLLGGPFSFISLTLIPHRLFMLLYPSPVLPKGLADLCTSFLGHSPPPPFAHTSDQSVSSDFTEDIKNGACTANVLTETRAQDSAPLALTSVWLTVQEHF